MSQITEQLDEEVLDTLTEAAESSFEITDDLGDMLRAYAQKKQDKKDLEAQLKDINAQMEKINEQLVRLMDARGVRNIKLDNYGTFYQNTRTYTSVKDAGALIDWLDEHDEGAIARRSVHPATLQSWWNERLQNGEEVPGENIVGAFTKTTVALRKGK